MFVVSPLSLCVGVRCCNHSNTLIFLLRSPQIKGQPLTTSAAWHPHTHLHIPTLYHIDTHNGVSPTCQSPDHTHTQTHLQSFNVTWRQWEFSETCKQTPRFQFTRKEELSRNDESVLAVCWFWNHHLKSPVSCPSTNWVILNISVTAGGKHLHH